MELTDDIGLLTHRMNEDLPKMEWIQLQYTRNLKLIDDTTSVTHSNHYIAQYLYSKQSLFKSSLKMSRYSFISHNQKSYGTP